MHIINSKTSLNLNLVTLKNKNRWEQYRYTFLLLLLFAFNQHVSAQTNQDEFRTRPFLLAINRPEGSLAYTYLNLIYSEVFKRLNMEFKIKYIPLKRGFANVASGKFDGETTRVYKYQDSHPTLIRVTEPLYSTNVSAFALSDFKTRLNGWNSLIGHHYKVEYPRGVYISELNLNKVVPAENLSKIKTASQGIQKLLRNRTDIFIDDELVVYPLLNALKDLYPQKIHQVGVMEPVPLYMYIHEKNKWLEPHLSKIITEMKDENLMKKYRKIVFNF